MQSILAGKEAPIHRAKCVRVLFANTNIQVYVLKITVHAA
jgi:hypothetical protein